MIALRHRSAPRTHVGLVRKVNEDAMLARDDTALWVVADGMGGHDNGQWASQTLIAQFAALDLPHDPGARGAAMIAAFEAGNTLINDAAQAAGKQMGTTCVLFHLGGDDALFLWVGDSRIYRSRSGEMTQVTRDHTVVQELVDRGSLAAEDAETHPMSHVLSRAVGTEATLHYDCIVDKARPGDRYLLCSDGITKVVPEPLIARLLARANIDAVADQLLAETLERGAPDNTTLIVVSVEESTALTPQDAS